MDLLPEIHGPIGVFDSGYGGLTILDEIRRAMPQYDYVYLGDNARAPYGTRSFEIVYKFTLEAVVRLFEEGCPLVILACNTASAKALRSIQQNDLLILASDRRVLGVIRPTVEVIGNMTKTRKIGVLGTLGTIQSESYPLEIKKLYPDIEVYSEPCPMWVPLIENNEHNSPGADYFVKLYIDRLMNKCSQIDTVILGCTHYPILLEKIKKYLPSGVQAVAQGEWVARSLSDYFKRHPEMDNRCTKQGTCRFYTTESEAKFMDAASLFLHEKLDVRHITLG